jgi:type II secretory pathway component HofQ
MIATAANVGLVVSDDVTGNVTLQVDNVTWRQAIDVIAHLENLVVTEVEGVVLVKQQR